MKENAQHFYDQELNKSREERKVADSLLEKETHFRIPAGNGLLS